METAYQFRHEDEPEKMATFSDGIHKYYADPSSKLRGLCAENLFSVMLNASDNRRHDLELQFEREIRRWLCDEDCWVLEHVHRYFHTLLHVRSVKDSRFMEMKESSRLFMDLDNWWACGRQEFLTHIEESKKKDLDRRRNRRWSIPTPRFWRPDPISAGR